MVAHVKKRPQIPRLDGGPQTVLLVNDVERAASFYGDSLRLKLKDRDGARYAEFITGGDATLTLLRRDGSIAPMAIDVIPPENVALTFTLVPTELESWKSWLAKHGVSIERETKWIHGGRSLYVRDPDGRKLEFKTPPTMKPPAKH